MSERDFINLKGRNQCEDTFIDESVILKLDVSYMFVRTSLLEIHHHFQSLCVQSCNWWIHFLYCLVI